MYMEALENEVESLSAEVTRLRLMLQRVTQVMEFPVSVDSLPSFRDPVAATLSRTAPPHSVTVTHAPPSPANTVAVPVELLQRLLEQQQQQSSRSPRPAKVSPQQEPTRHITRISKYSLASSVNDGGEGADVVSRESSSRGHESGAESVKSNVASAGGVADAPQHAPSSTLTSTRRASSASKTKEKTSSTGTRPSHSSSGKGTSARTDDPQGSTRRKSSVGVANPVTADWRLPSPITKVVLQPVQKPPQPVIQPPPEHDSDSDNAKGESRATHHTRKSQSSSVMPLREMPTKQERSRSASEMEESSTQSRAVSAPSRRESDGMMVSNSAWASAMHGYFDGDNFPSSRQSPQPLSQAEAGEGDSAAVPPAMSGSPNYTSQSTGQSIEFSQQGMFSYSMLGSLANGSPAMSSVQAHSATPVAEEVVGMAVRALRAPPQVEELPSSSHVMNSKKVPRQTSVMTYRSDDTDDDASGGGGGASPSVERRRPTEPPLSRATGNAVAMPLAPAVLGARRVSASAAPPTNDDSPMRPHLRGSNASATPSQRPSLAQPGMRTPQHKKSVFDIVREQGDDSSDSSDSDDSSDATSEKADSKLHDAEDALQPAAQASAPSGKELGSVSYGTARDAYSAGFYSPQFTPQESQSPAGQSLAPSMPGGASYAGYEYDIGLETSQSRSRSRVASPHRDVAENLASGGYYPV